MKDKNKNCLCGGLIAIHVDHIEIHGDQIDVQWTWLFVA
jgi:hypothetical protein